MAAEAASMCGEACLHTSAELIPAQLGPGPSKSGFLSASVPVSSTEVEGPTEPDNEQTGRIGRAGYLQAGH